MQLPHTLLFHVFGTILECRTEQIEGHFKNQEIVENFTLLLTTLYQESPEYQVYISTNDGN